MLNRVQFSSPYAQQKNVSFSALSDTQKRYLKDKSSQFGEIADNYEKIKNQTEETRSKAWHYRALKAECGIIQRDLEKYD